MPSTLHLLVCVSGIYAAFLSWALLQERLSTTPYYDPHHAGDKPKYFRHVLFLNTVQSTFSALAALLYVAVRQRTSWFSAVGLDATCQIQQATSNDSSRRMLLKFFQCALMASISSPFGYASLRYIDYPTQILGKSCKLVPVMLMNIILYRRKFALHKYLVVATVTLGISLFMLFAPTDAGKASRKASNPLLGISLLLVNLLLDGAMGSTQDEVFVQYKVTSTQMMLWMNTFATMITFSTMLLPLPSIPILNPSSSHGHSELANALAFIQSHPAVLKDIIAFSLAGALGQLFIYDTLQSFGSLTLTTITVTRKLFTMLLSLVVFNHHLVPGQWLGVCTVFAGIGIEAIVKRNEIIAKRELKRRQLKAAKDGDPDGGLRPIPGSQAAALTRSGRITPIDEKQRLKDL